jgi:hypothetical protein
MSLTAAPRLEADVGQTTSPAELLDVLASELGLMLPTGTVLSCAGLGWATPGS